MEAANALLNSLLGGVPLLIKSPKNPRNTYTSHEDGTSPLRRFDGVFRQLHRALDLVQFLTEWTLEQMLRTMGTWMVRFISGLVVGLVFVLLLVRFVVWLFTGA